MRGGALQVCYHSIHEFEEEILMPGLFVHSGFLWKTVCEARDRAVVAVRENPQVWPADTIVAIVLAAAAAEAFINELTELVALQRDAAYRRTNPISLPLRAFADALQEIEESRGNLALKYLMASQTLSGSTFDKGSNPYQDFATLIHLRNDLMHLKPRDTFLEPENGLPGIIQPPGYIKALQQRALAHTPPKGVGMSWLNMLQTAQMSAWACDTAHSIILAVLNFIPDESTPDRDPAWMLKDFFRKKQPAPA
jgi:hypothetical protein